MVRYAVIALLPFIAAWAPAPAYVASTSATTEATGCFYTDQVRNYRTSGDSTLYVRDMRDNVFQLETFDCRDLADAQSLVFTSARGQRTICTGDRANLSSASSTSLPSRCQFEVKRIMHASDVAALPRSERP